MRRGARGEEESGKESEAKRRKERGCCGNPPSVVFTLASCCHCSRFLSQRNASFLCTHSHNSPLCLSAKYIFILGGEYLWCFCLKSCVKKRNESRRSDADHRMHMFSLSFFLFKILALLTNQTARSDLVNTLNNTHTLYLLFPSYTAILPAFTVFCFPVTSSSHSLSPSSPRGLSANLLPLLLVWFSVCFAR